MFCRVPVFLALLTSSLWAQLPTSVYSVELDGRVVAYTIQDGFAITQGDIILGRATDVESYRTSVFIDSPASAKRKRPASLAATNVKRWPNATMYYVIDADTPVQQNLLDAIDYWNKQAPFKILPRTNEPNYVRFQKLATDAACASAVGMVGGEQSIGVTVGCTVGSAIHELGHSWGLLHEQSRTDRGAYVTVLYENIDKRYLGNFNQGSSTVDLGFYDYDSIMHYPAQGFARNFQDTLETVPVGIPIGQRIKLSAGDLDGVLRFYGAAPSLTTITTTPEGLPITVDSQAYTSPQTFDWAVGSQHTVDTLPLASNSGNPGLSLGPVPPLYQFVRWSDAGDISHTLTAAFDRTVFVAQYVRLLGIQTAVSQGQGTTSIFPLPANGYLPERSQFLVKASPSDGYQFIRWAGTTYLGSNGSSVSNANAKLEVLSGAANYQATFTASSLSVVDSQPRGTLVNVDGTGYYTPVSFAWTAGSSHTLSYNSPQYQGTNTQRFNFVRWEDGSVGLRTVKATAGPGTYTATFSKQYILTAAPLGNGNVTVSPASSNGYYDAGSTVHIIATPGSGASLRYWIGDLAGSNTEASVIMDQDKYFVANFGTPLPWLMLNSASFALNPIPLTTGQAVAPGELVSIFGAGIGPANEQFPSPDADGKLPNTIAGVSVTFDGKFAASLTYAGPNQINAVVPFGIAGQTSTVVTVKNLQASLAVGIAAADTAPALFTYDGSGHGPVAALNQDGTVNSQFNPASAGSVVVLYGTGAGVWNKSFPDGQIMGADLAFPAAPVFVRFGKLDAQVLYAGTSPYLVNGMLQVNVTIPVNTIGAEDTAIPVPIQMIIGKYTSAPGTSIWIE